jgi:hypothetical protein
LIKTARKNNYMDKNRIKLKSNMANQYLLIILFIFILSGNVIAQQEDSQKNPDTLIIGDAFSEGAFPLVSEKKASPLYYDTDDYEVVKIAVKDLQSDIEKVSHVAPEITSQLKLSQRTVVIIGTIGKCKELAGLSEQKKVNVEDIRNQWETFKILVVDNPFPDIDKALVIAGSDRRGTAYGVYELSKQIGVSPWYYWADVPVDEKDEIWIKQGDYQLGPPSVKYRGMFINDEKFALKLWAAEKQDPEVKGIGINTMQKVFELMLRTRSNYIWEPGNLAMAKLADDYAIVLGSPHNRAMMSGHMDKKYGDWLYHTNKENIYKFWDDKIKERGGFENVYTIGMRGRGDMPMDGGLSTDEIVALMEQILSDQREILSKNIDKPIEEIPQSLVLYKEVLDLYNQGIKVPDDVTLVWPDDNYGYIKRLSNKKEQLRSGGAGVYYHLSYLGRPQTYLWLSTINPLHMWEELQKAYDYNARKLWVFNVGDIKPAEYSYTLAMDMAWDISKFNKDNIKKHLAEWMGPIFGEALKPAIADIMYEYYRLAFERKPEYMGWNRIEPDTPIVDTEFSFVNYREAERRLDSTKRNKERAEVIYKSLNEADKPAFYELVYYPVACAYFMDARMLLAQQNRLYAKQGRASTNNLARLAESYTDSAVLATKFYDEMLDGKWNNVIHEGGRRQFYMPPTTKIEIPAAPQMGIACEGFKDKKMVSDKLALPWFNNIYKKQYYFEVFNKGRKPFDYEILTSDDWVKLSSTKGTCDTESRIMVDIDYEKLAEAEKEEHEGVITVHGAGSMQKIKVFVFTPVNVEADELAGLFVEDNGVIAMNAENFHRKKDRDGYGWEITKHLGVTGSSIGAYPFTAEPVEHEWRMEKDAAYAEYDFYCFNTDWVDIYSYSLPTFPLNSQRHCLYGISVDGAPPLIIDFETRLRSEYWKQNVQRNQSIDKTKHFIQKKGKHTLKIWMIDTGVFIDKIVIDFGGLKKSYMGPLQTKVK